MSGRRHIVFVTSSLAGGGAERVLLTMAEYWAGVGHGVTIVVLRPRSPGEYHVPRDVQLERLVLIDETNPVSDWRHLGRLIRLRKKLRTLAPDLVIPFIDKLNTAVLIALCGSGIPVIATEHLAPWMNPLGAVWETLRRLSYPTARVVVSPTPAITRWFVTHCRGRFETLPYPAHLYSASRAIGVRDRRIIAVGRLAHQKGFDLLIAAFSDLAEDHPDWYVEIAGEGPARPSLELMIRERGLCGRVRLLGQIADLRALYSGAEIFVLPSRHEAYPMVLCEALSAGCCVVAADCPTGPREILSDPSAGVLIPVDDVPALAQALRRLMTPSRERERMREAAVSLATRLGPQSVMQQWDVALERWTSQRP